jgi:hypothetical protein
MTHNGPDTAAAAAAVIGVVLQSMVGMFARCTQQAVDKLDTAIKASADSR